MRGRVDLNARPKEAVVSYSHLAHVENHTVKVEVNTIAQIDVFAIVTKEWGLHPDRFAATAEQTFKNPATLLLVAFTRHVQFLTEIPRNFPSFNQLGIKSIVKFPGQHLLSFRAHFAVSVKERLQQWLTLFVSLNDGRSGRMKNVKSSSALPEAHVNEKTTSVFLHPLPDRHGRKQSRTIRNYRVSQNDSGTLNGLRRAQAVTI